MREEELEEKVQQLDPDIGAKALFFAALQADELEMQQKLMVPRKQFIGEKALELASMLEEAQEEAWKGVVEGFVYLRDRVQKLPSSQKESFEKMFLQMKDRMFEIMSSNPNNIGDILEKYGSCQTLQELLGLPMEFMEWMYQIAKGLFEDKNFFLASQIFYILSIYHPFIPSYQIGLALSHKQLGNYELSLLLFNNLTLLVPEDPQVRYHSVDLYLHCNQIEEALIELQLLLQIIDQTKQEAWRPYYNALSEQIKGRKGSCQ